MARQWWCLCACTSWNYMCEHAFQGPDDWVIIMKNWLYLIDITKHFYSKNDMGPLGTSWNCIHVWTCFSRAWQLSHCHGKLTLFDWYYQAFLLQKWYGPAWHSWSCMCEHVSQGPDDWVIVMENLHYLKNITKHFFSQNDMGLLSTSWNCMWEHVSQGPDDLVFVMENWHYLIDITKHFYSKNDMGLLGTSWNYKNMWTCFSRA